MLLTLLTSHVSKNIGFDLHTYVSKEYKNVFIVFYHDYTGKKI